MQVEFESALEHPFFVFDQGWASCYPERTLQCYGLKCHRLQVGDVCICLTPRTKSTKKAENSRKRRWSAPDQFCNDDEEEASASMKRTKDWASGCYLNTMFLCNVSFQCAGKLNTSKAWSPSVGVPVESQACRLYDLLVTHSALCTVMEWCASESPQLVCRLSESIVRCSTLCSYNRTYCWVFLCPGLQVVWLCWTSGLQAVWPAGKLHHPMYSYWTKNLWVTPAPGVQVVWLSGESLHPVWLWNNRLMSLCL
jgi:hypothetical protein